jgi:hypothetical protein
MSFPENSNWPQAANSDCSSPEALITAFDDCLGFAGGQFSFNRDRFLSLFIPNATIVSPTKWEMVTNPEGFADIFVGLVDELGIRDKGFVEANRIVKSIRIGDVQSIYTHYMIPDFDGAADPFAHGINMWHTAFFQDRYWIISLMWVDEDENAPTPAELQ